MDGINSKYGKDHKWGKHYSVRKVGRDLHYAKFDNLYIPIPEIFKEDLVSRFSVFEKIHMTTCWHQYHNQWRMCKEYAMNYCEGCPFTLKYKLIVSCIDWQKNIDPLFNTEWLHIGSRLQHKDEIEVFWEKAKHFIEFTP